MKFTGKGDFGAEMVADAAADVGGGESAATPIELLAFALGACSGMDVVSILRKMKQEITSYTIHVEVDRPTNEYPRPVRKAHIVHVLSGPALEPGMVEKAVRLSDEKYCAVAASLRFPAEVTGEYRIE
jgi:putative redox protein